MPIGYDVTETGDETTNHFDVTVIFQTANIESRDISELREQAGELLKKRDTSGRYVGSVPTRVDSREISMFARPPRTGAIIHYETESKSFGPEGFKRAKGDSRRAIEHLKALIELFDGTPVIER